MGAPAYQLSPDVDTFPKLVSRNAQRFPRKVAIREKDFGIWHGERTGRPRWGRQDP